MAVFDGTSNPASMEEFLQSFIAELNDLFSNGFHCRGVHFTVSEDIRFICDSPARADVKESKGHTAFDGCERCTVKGYKVGRVTVFLGTDHPKRTGESFRNFVHIEHHNASSPLLAINPEIDLVKKFILDTMHLIYLGGVLRILEFLMSTDSKVKLSATQKEELARRLKLIKKDIPEEFPRKIKTTEKYAKYKATDLRFFFVVSVSSSYKKNFKLTNEKSSVITSCCLQMAIESQLY